MILFANIDHHYQGGALGPTDPYCQPQHMPHPTMEELRDKKYFARLQVLHCVFLKIIEKKTK